MPYLMMLGAVGFMFGTGGSALIAKTMGEGNQDKANRLFSMFVYVSTLVGIVLAVVAIFALRPVSAALGAQGQMLDDSVTYGRIILFSLPALMLQYEFQSFFVTAGKPQLGLAVTVAAGDANMVLDALFVAVFDMGIVGAAVATAVSQYVGGIVPLFYFFRRNSSLLRLGKTEFDGRSLFKACTNGSSEFLTNISMSVVNMLYNSQLMKYAGENGVAAYGTLMYVNMIFIAVFIGYSVGTAPVIGYHYGAENNNEIKSILKKSIGIIGVSSVLMLIAGEVLAKPLSMLFVGYDESLLTITLRGFVIFSFSFLFAGVPIFGSSFFTALNNGLVSAAISFLRTVVFQVVAVMLMPLIWGLDGIWFSVVTAEVAAAGVTVIFVLANRKKYKY